MTFVLTVPPTVDEQAFDTLVAQSAEGAGRRVLFDARHVRWADPFGLLGLLALGQTATEAGGRPILQLPDSADVTSYLARMGFVDHAETIFELHGPGRARRGSGGSSVLLEITPIRSHEDVHSVIDLVQDRASAILTEQLKYSNLDAGKFSMVLSEGCQNIIEHAESGGWVGIQTYNWAKRLGRPVVQIAVVDLGVGFRGSLAKAHAARYGDRWSDATALEAAFIHGITRFRDPGRGQGIKQMRRSVGRWGGKIAIRSGTGRIADVPEWDDSPPMQTGLAAFPGSQIQILLPAREAASAPKERA